ncbi:nuclear transport factor 2 family protein [Vibrio salinus]|uniref:nuclear transport factor 2 family protein n=1 Tax=Vibrio salinus TaxID=2899784 RepID=UPI001E5E3481|nr:nuclear transport factor 2 family protein [Vibrio salinus]MCE0492694.1 nuclear transport factor 2 family protein [Vibrio salinus]
MEKDTIEQIQESEALLCKAMLASDIDVLDQLLSPELIFTNHLGMVLGKNDDLGAHQSGLLHILNISVDEQQIKLQKDTAVVFVKMNILGTYDGNPANGSFRFTRVWQKTTGNHWQVIAAHSSLMED